MLSGTEHGVTTLVARVTILAPCRTTHLLMTTKAAQMIRPLQAWLVKVIQRRVLHFFPVDRFGGERFRLMAALTADNRLRAAVLVAADTVGVGDLDSGGVVMAEPAISQGIDMVSMVELDRSVIVLNRADSDPVRNTAATADSGCQQHQYAHERNHLSFNCTHNSLLGKMADTPLSRAPVVSVGTE